MMQDVWSAVAAADPGWLARLRARQQRMEVDRLARVRLIPLPRQPRDMKLRDVTPGLLDNGPADPGRLASVVRIRTTRKCGPTVFRRAG
jgi:hypothetical protein